MNDLKVISISEEKHFNGVVFPLSLAPTDSIQTVEQTVAYLKSNMTTLLDLLLKHGAILFRGFPISDAKDFNEFALAFGWQDLPYIGGAAVRTNVHGVVFTSNESPPDQPIPFHHEMAQVPKFPSYLFFYCDVPATEGGDTPICLSNVVYEQLNQEKPKFVEDLKQKGVKYTRVLPEEDDPSSPIGRGWKSTYLTNDKKVAEERCTQHGGSYEWLPNGDLKTISKVLPAIRIEERTSKPTWFNSIVAAYFGWKDKRNQPERAVTYGDDSPLNPEDVTRANQVLEENCVSFKWLKGDIILVDNKLVLHSRGTFVPPRRILAALFQ